MAATATITASPGRGGDDNGRELVRIGNALFGKKLMLLNLWQILATEVYQSRADFTHIMIDGDEFLKDQYESVPSQNRRDFAYAMGALSRSKAQVWFTMKARDETRNTDAAKAWLSMARDKQYSLLYSWRANFQRAMQQGDNDFVTFGNAVHSVLEDAGRNKIPVYDTHHLRDCAWFEDQSRHVVGMYRKFKVVLANWKQQLPKVPMPAKYTETLEKHPHTEVELWHVSIPVDFYDFYKKKMRNPGHRYASIYLDPSDATTLWEGANFEFPYIVRRWFLHSESQYAHSPAAMYGLIDARLLQAQSRVILEAGERVIDPPMIAKSDGVVSKINNYPGAVSYVDASYDERQGEALRAIRTEANIPLGLELKQDTRQVLAAAWFLNKLNLPSDKDMTAFEVNERISEYIRSIGPAIEPFQDDNANVLEHSFEMNLRLQNFGPPQMIPKELRGQDIAYEFEGPLQMAYKRQKLANGKEVLGIYNEIAQTNQQNPPKALQNFNLDGIARDMIDFADAQPGWKTPLDQLAQQRAQEQAQMQQMQTDQKAAIGLQQAHAAAELAPKLAAANQSIPAITQDTSGQPPPSPSYAEPEYADANA